MIKKIKKNLGLFYINSIVFLLSIFAFEVNAETKIIAKNGDNLFKISKQYGIPLKELMYKNNITDATKIIEGEIIIIPLKSNNKERKNQYTTYKVIKGDTLYKIARDYNLNLKDIISINNLNNDSYLKLNQIILLPEGAIHKKEINREDFKLARKKVFYHQTSHGEFLSDIAEIHKVPREEIITLNKLNDSEAIDPNTKFKIRVKNRLKWLKYGSITIKWSDWTYFDGNYIAPAKTKKNTSFYLALSCKKRALNNTLNNSYWTSWYFPKNDFEFKLISDFCDKDFKF
ncbi:lytic transglycosylase [Prochlorococcus marinus]|uniref:lytic transglycosylase n=1 Tax=Prochlorococcus marinus TaxID=1219 RepID=UPI0022B33F7F|nr:LysM peptidoglycan-binding domain-containing protein [Prochlorococcus marinus]